MYRCDIHAGMIQVWSQMSYFQGNPATHHLTKCTVVLVHWDCEDWWLFDWQVFAVSAIQNITSHQCANGTHNLISPLIPVVLSCLLRIWKLDIQPPLATWLSYPANFILADFRGIQFSPFLKSASREERSPLEGIVYPLDWCMLGKESLPFWS